MVSGPWNLERVRQSPVNWSVASFPDGGSSFVNVLGYMLNARGPDPLFAWHFLQSQVLTDDGMEALQAAAPGIPAWLPLLDNLDDPMMAQMGRIAAQGRAVPTIAEIPRYGRFGVKRSSRGRRGCRCPGGLHPRAGSKTGRHPRPCARRTASSGSAY